MSKKVLTALLFAIIAYPVMPQTGGDNIYEFLNLTHSGLVASLGGANVSMNAGDLNMAHHNPALLNNAMDRSLALNYVNYFAGINYGMALYSRSFQGAGNFAAGLTYLNYGSFREADETGIITGSFTASEYSFSVIWSYSIDTLLSVGINLKPVLSHLERYTSFGLAADLGISWHNRANLFSAGLVFRNAGYQVTTYAGEAHQKLPFEIQAGISQRLAYAPFRFSLTMRHLEKWDLTHQYITSATTENDGSSSPEFLENMMRHLILGVELIPHKNFWFSAGYNYQRRKELQVESKVSTVGFSWGFGINTSLLNIEFGRATYHLAGSSTHLSLILKTRSIFQKLRN